MLCHLIVNVSNTGPLFLFVANFSLFTNTWKIFPVLSHGRPFSHFYLMAPCFH